MLGQTNDEIKETNGAIRIAIRDALITFILTCLSVLIANPPFNISLLEWVECLYVPILTAVFTAILSYAHAVGVKRT